MKVDGWAIVQEDGSVEFYTKLPKYFTSANHMHIYKAVLSYGKNIRKPKKKKGTKK